MKLVARSVIAALALGAIATPAMAGEWVYHGGPKAPDSVAWYEPDSGYYGAYGNYAPAHDAVPYGPPYAAPDDDD